MALAEPQPLTSLASARDAARVSALWAAAHPLGPCAGDPAPSAADAWGIEQGSELVALGAVRTWGRVGHVHGLAVAEAHRGRGLGAALLNELVRELERRDAAVIGIEADDAGPAVLATLARGGFKPVQPAFIVEGPLSASGDSQPAPEFLLLRGAEGAGQLQGVRGLAACVDAELDPTAWLTERLRRGEADVLLQGPASEPQALAVLPVTPGSDALAVSMLLCASGPPREVIPPVLAALSGLARERSLDRIQVAAPSRHWEAVRVLLDAGFRPRASCLRFTRQGSPERADAGRTCLATWR